MKLTNERLVKWIEQIEAKFFENKDVLAYYIENYNAYVVDIGQPRYQNLEIKYSTHSLTDLS